MRYRERTMITKKWVVKKLWNSLFDSCRTSPVTIFRLRKEGRLAWSEREPNQELTAAATSSNCASMRPSQLVSLNKSAMDVGAHRFAIMGI